MTIFLIVLFAALVFEYINGFHDSANAIATSISTKALTPRMAIMLAAVMNLLGALWGTAVAKTISEGLVDAVAVNMHVIAAALMSGITWNLITWWFGIPSSSSHTLIGSLCGSALAKTTEVNFPELAAAANHALPVGYLPGDIDWSVLFWSIDNGTKGIWPKLVMPMLLAPVFGLFFGMLVMFLFFFIFRNRKPAMVQHVFRKLQIISAAGMGFAHGTSDAQKTMGIITLALIAGTTSGVFVNNPDWLGFLNLSEGADVPVWVKILCAIVMAAGTAGGGYRIIRTMSHKMTKLLPVNGFAAELTSATVLIGTSQLGMPVSTTHVVSSSIMGVGVAKDVRRVNFSTITRILWAWTLTLPVSMLLGYGIYNAIVWLLP
ncbi:MAG: inorganic phosphate transporter [Opitutales bacterium]|nr:inorganic phosphate transporter [Opitutales bacterium]